MRITDLLHASHPFPSLEIVPPLGGISKNELLENIAPLMEFKPRYINVTTHRDEVRFDPQPDGTFVRKVVRSRVSPVAVCGSIQARYDVMALRGDSLTGEKRFTPEPDGYAHADELVRAIRAMEGGDRMCIGVGGYPEKHFEAANLDTDIANLKRKVDAGADLIITQMFYDNAVFFRFVDRCRNAGISVPIIPGLKPLSAARQIEVIPEAFSIDLPIELTEEVRKAGNDKEAVRRIGIEWCTAQCRELLYEGVPAVHFYTMGKSTNVVEVLRNCF